jgi:DNA-binding MarR family transcriptional regulator
MTSAFDPKNQELNIESKIVVALERISEAFKVSLWNENKKYGLSPIQLQILTFLLFHSQELRTISHLAIEFNSTKASISDSVKTLETKKIEIHSEKI